MAILNSLIAWRMKKRYHQIELFMKYPGEVQKECLRTLTQTAKNTEWGKKHNYSSIQNLKDFQNQIPLQDYNSLKGYIDRMIKGEEKVLWPGDIKWFAKSSGTTSDKSKFIPVSEESLYDCHYKAGKDMLSIYCNQFEDTQVFTGKTVMMGGSSQVNPNRKGSYTADLSAILIDNLPFWVTRQQAPHKEIVLMGDWEEKIEKMADGIIKENITSLSGVPSWTQVLFQRVLEKTGASNVKDIWPNFELYMHGAVNFDPYRERFAQLAPNINYLETYNASEGFFGIQFENNVSDFLLMLDYGIFYEFIIAENIHQDEPQAIGIEDVEVGINYAVVISTNGGLWRYVLGDTIEFTSTDPHRIRITGRTRHFINAFGEEVIIDNTDKALQIACSKTDAIFNEYTAAPKFQDDETTACHEWIIEFDQEPNNKDFFVEALDNALKSLNSDYEAKRYKDILLSSPKIHFVKKGTFYEWLKQQGKLGGQHKVPRLNNDRKYVESVLKIKI